MFNMPSEHNQSTSSRNWVSIDNCPRPIVLLIPSVENVSKPYCATVMIHDKQYGQGFGASKKEAKNEAGKCDDAVFMFVCLH